MELYYRKYGFSSGNLGNRQTERIAVSLGVWYTGHIKWKQGVFQMIMEIQDPAALYGYEQKFPFPYHFPTSCAQWEQSMFRDTDGAGRRLFWELILSGWIRTRPSEICAPGIFMKRTGFSGRGLPGAITWTFRNKKTGAAKAD